MMIARPVPIKHSEHGAPEKRHTVVHHHNRLHQNLCQSQQDYQDEAQCLHRSTPRPCRLRPASTTAFLKAFNSRRRSHEHRAEARPIYFNRKDSFDCGQLPNAAKRYGFLVWSQSFQSEAITHCRFKEVSVCQNP
jgi:hypothetical protein